MDPILTLSSAGLTEAARIQETVAAQFPCSPIQCLHLPQDTPGHYELLVGLEMCVLGLGQLLSPCPALAPLIPDLHGSALLQVSFSNYNKLFQPQTGSQSVLSKLVSDEASPSATSTIVTAAGTLSHI